MTPSDQLTILLPLKDRVPFTQRWLNYAVHARFPFRIMIADGGSDSTVAELAAATESKGLDVEYIRYPFDSSYSDYYAKMASALSRVSTPFVVLADNDDLLVPSGLASAVQFLLENPAYAACGGQCAVFWASGSNRQKRRGAVYGKNVAWKCSATMHSDVADTASQRLIDQSLGASDVFYAVHRTDQLRRQFEIIRDFNPSDLFLMEQLSTFLTAVSGKCRQLDCLYIARQQDSPGSSGGEHQARYGGWFDRMLLPTWSDDFGRFVGLAADALAQADAISVDAARQVILKCYKMSVAPTILAELLPQPTVRPAMPLVLQLVGRLVRLPQDSLIRIAAQRCYRQGRWLSHDLLFGGAVRSRHTNQASDEFKPVLNFLTAVEPHNA